MFNDLIHNVGVFETAEKLMQDFSESEQKRSSLPWSHPTRLVLSYTFDITQVSVSRDQRLGHVFQDKRLNGRIWPLQNKILSRTLPLTDLAAVGIGVHHAGISMEDRKATEQFYAKKVLRILVATSVCTFISFPFCIMLNWL